MAPTDKEKTTSIRIVQYQKQKSLQKEIQDFLRNMNEMQSRIFYQVREWLYNIAWNQYSEPLHLFLTWGAGTGKSHTCIIKCIFHETNSVLSKSVPYPDAMVALITAPTGTAAFNIGGMTLHSAFGISKNMKLSTHL